MSGHNRKKEQNFGPSKKGSPSRKKGPKCGPSKEGFGTRSKPLLGDVTLADYANASILPGRGRLPKAKATFDVGREVKNLNIEDKAWDEKLVEFEGDCDFVEEGNKAVTKTTSLRTKTLGEIIADEGADNSYPLPSYPNSYPSYSKTQIIEIRGIPMMENEDIYYILKEIAKALGINYNRDAIFFAHRLPAPRGNPFPPNIVVQFTSKSTKAMWIASGREKKLNTTDLSSSLRPTPIFIEEQLTPLKKAILGLAKSYVREGQLSSAWVREGEIFVRRSPDSAAVRVKSVFKVESVVESRAVKGGRSGEDAGGSAVAASEEISESAKSKVKHLNIEDKAWDEKLEEFEGDFDFVFDGVNEEGKEVFVMKRTSLGNKTLGESIADKGASKSYPLHSNNQNVEIRGIPMMENEDIHYILEEIAKALGIDYDRDAIFFAHRLPAPRGNPFPPSIVVQFTSTSTKAMWIASGKEKKLSTSDLSLSIPPVPISIVEQLTPLKKAVLGLAKSYVKEGQLVSALIQKGEIVVRRSLDSAAVRVQSVSELESVVTVKGCRLGEEAGSSSKNAAVAMSTTAATKSGKKKMKKLRTTDQSSSLCSAPIFVEENLTPLNRAVLDHAQSYVRKGQLASAWVQEGKIFVRRLPYSAAVRVQTISGVESVVAVKGSSWGDDSSGSGGNMAVAMSTMVASTPGKKKKKKKLTTTNLSSPLVENQLPIVENLTPLNRVVLEHAKLCVREGQLASAWVQEGEVFARRSLDSAAVRLSEVESVVAMKGGRSAEDAGGSGSNTGGAIATTAASASGKKKEKKKKKQPRTMDLLSSLRPAPIFVEENLTPLNTAVLEHPKSYAAVAMVTTAALEKNSESAISMDKNTLNAIRLRAALRGQPGAV